MSRRRRRGLSKRGGEVLRLFHKQPERSFYGLEIIKEAKISSGSLYPLLGRLEARGLLTSSWKESTEQHRPRRRFYRLNPHSSDGVAQLLDEWRAKYEPAQPASINSRQQPATT